MKFLLDFGPIVVFFLAYKFYNLNVAICAMIISTFAQIIYTRTSSGKFVSSQVLTFILLIVFGGITLWLNDEKYFMWKLSVLYVIFAIALIASIWIGKKTLLERMMGKELQLPGVIWVRLTWLWSFGFVGIALVNAYVYVIPYLSLKDSFFKSEMIDPKTKVENLDCSQMGADSLCLATKHAMDVWVNFKLFGTLGLTLVLIVITVLMLSKHIKEKQTNA
jgi:intracellular septation protein